MRSSCQRQLPCAQVAKLLVLQLDTNRHGDQHSQCCGLAVSGKQSRNIIRIAWQVHFIVASCENMVNGKAMRPGDVLTAANGKTVEARLLPRQAAEHHRMRNGCLQHDFARGNTRTRIRGAASTRDLLCFSRGMRNIAGEQHGCRGAADAGRCAVVCARARESLFRNRHRHAHRCIACVCCLYIVLSVPLSRT